MLKKEFKKGKLDEDELEEEEKKEVFEEDAKDFANLDEDEDLDDSPDSFPEEEAFVDEES